MMAVSDTIMPQQPLANVPAARDTRANTGQNTKPFEDVVQEQNRQTLDSARKKDQTSKEQADADADGDSLTEKAHDDAQEDAGLAAANALMLQLNAANNAAAKGNANEAIEAGKNADKMTGEIDGESAEKGTLKAKMAEAKGKIQERDDGKGKDIKTNFVEENTKRVTAVEAQSDSSTGQREGPKKASPKLDLTALRSDSQARIEPQMANSEKQQGVKNLEVGDKVDLKGFGAKVNQLSRIENVEVTQNRKIGDMHVLSIKLNPEDLGSVDARMRLTHNGLQIELRAERQETARLLAADQQMLSKAIEKAGLNDDGRVSVTIVDRSGQASQVQNAAQGQGAQNQNQGGQQQGQNFSGQNGQNHQNNQHARNGFDTALTGKAAAVAHEHSHASRDPRRLVV